MFDLFISTHIHYTMSWATVDQASSSPGSWIGAHWARRAHTPPMGPWRLVPKCRDQDEFDEFWSIPIALSNSSFPFISIHFPWLCRNPEAMIRKRWQSRPWPWSQDSYCHIHSAWQMSGQLHGLHVLHAHFGFLEPQWAETTRWICKNEEKWRPQFQPWEHELIWQRVRRSCTRKSKPAPPTGSQSRTWSSWMILESCCCLYNQNEN